MKIISEEMERKMNEAPMGEEITKECMDILNLLLEKNIAYGNSAIQPIRIFSSASTREQLFVRIDDKLSRIQRGSEYPGDDTINDLIGYLILLKVATVGD